MGNTQRLPDGNTVLGWGAPYTKGGYTYLSIVETAPDNRTLFELTFDQPYVSYRAFRFPWRGFPDTQPALASKTEGSMVTLGYSWNGATEVTAYRVYGGNSSQSLHLIEQRQKTNYETQSHLMYLPEGECYFQVAAMDKSGNELARSKIISTDRVHCPLQP